jgi:hypothetical protein
MRVAGAVEIDGGKPPARPAQGQAGRGRRRAASSS